MVIVTGFFVDGADRGATTTAVMSSVASHYSGIASRIKNAVARIAGVLAIAAAGALALLISTRILLRHTASLHFTAQTRTALQAEAWNLGNATVPAEVGAKDIPLVKRSLRLAFVESYRVLMLMSAGLAGLSALKAALLVEPKHPAETNDSQHEN